MKSDNEVVTSPGSDAGYLLEAQGITKRFGETVALDEARFDLRPGEVHALVGENGSGKSTLVKLFAGVHACDKGELSCGGAPLRLSRPADAFEHGIVSVLQEVLVVEPQTVLENLWLGSDSLFRSQVSQSEKRERAAEVLRRLLVNPPALEAVIEDLDLSDRQACCIARALLRKPKVLILDEATAALNHETRERLFTVVDELKAEGIPTVFISHRMDEVVEIADRVTVFRAGRNVEPTLNRGEWDVPQLVSMMSARETDEGDHRVARQARELNGDAVAMRCVDLRLRPEAAPINLTVRRGEILGLAGLDGQGQDEFLKSLWGESPEAGGKVVRIDGQRETDISSPRQARRSGIAYVPRERRAHALFGWMTILDNFDTANLRQYSRGGVLQQKLIRDDFDKYAGILKLKYGRPSDEIQTLSGGNQQKVVIARWLATEPEVLLLHDPTRGVDVGAKRDLYELLEQLVEKDIAVVMLSTEVDEHLELMDRVAVFRNQTLERIIPRHEATRDNLIGAYFGEEM